MAVMMGEEHYQAWGELLYSVQTGEIAFDKIFGKPIFEHLSDHPASAAIFDQAMTSVHGRETAPMVGKLRFLNHQHHRRHRRRQRYSDRRRTESLSTHAGNTV